MIRIEADSMLDLRVKLRGFLPIERRMEVELKENPDEITLIIPEKYRGKNIFILYLDK